jgi:NAD(P)-dependent dehydrogenase (short-subunit alcohol dehydrogenase family)
LPARSVRASPAFISTSRTPRRSIRRSPAARRRPSRSHPDPWRRHSIKEFKAEEAARAARIKIVAFAEVVSKALPRLKPTSSIVLFGGAAKARPYPGGTMVTIVNGAIVGMARTLAVELAPIRVNGISPGLVEDSPRWRKRVQEGAGPAVEAIRSRTPTRRLPTTEDIVHGVFFLMDNRAANGIDLELDGGILLV